MPKYIDAYGQPTTPDNPNRMMWYSARCTFWCDDWDKLKTVGPGIPVCPHCQSPGLQTEFSKWDRSAKRYEEQCADGYYTFLQDVKEKCCGTGVSITKAYKDWYSEGKNKLNSALKQVIDSEHTAG